MYPVLHSRQAFSGLPDCATSCLSESTSCSDLNDVACTCQNESFLTPVLICIGQTCNSTDAVTAENAYVRVCVAGLATLTTSSSTATSTDANPSNTGGTVSSPTKSSSLVGPIVGSIVAGFVVMTILALTLWRVVRKDKLAQQRRNWEVDPAAPGGTSGTTPTQPDMTATAPYDLTLQPPQLEVRTLNELSPLSDPPSDPPLIPDRHSPPNPKTAQAIFHEPSTEPSQPGPSHAASESAEHPPSPVPSQAPPPYQGRAINPPKVTDIQPDLIPPRDWVVTRSFLIM